MFPQPLKSLRAGKSWRHTTLLHFLRAFMYAIAREMFDELVLAGSISAEERDIMVAQEQKRLAMEQELTDDGTVDLSA